MRVAVGALQQPRRQPLRFGDPLGCRYWWLDPDQVEAYGDQLRSVSRKLELAVDAFGGLAGVPDETFAGEAADALRVRARRRETQADTTRADLRGLARAIHDYAEVLRRHRQALADLHDLAVSRGLTVESGRIWPPVEVLEGGSSQQVIGAWEADWKAYRDCYERRLEIREARVEGSRRLVRAITGLTGVRPDADRGHQVAPGHGSVGFGARHLADLRRDAAEEAMEAVAAHSDAARLRTTLDTLRRRELDALGELERLLRSGASPEELRAQVDRVALLQREVTEARSDLRDAEGTADREQAQADRAVRRVEAAQGLPPDLRDRLG